VGVEQSAEPILANTGNKDEYAMDIDVEEEKVAQQPRQSSR